MCAYLETRFVYFYFTKRQAKKRVKKKPRETDTYFSPFGNTFRCMHVV